MAVNHCKTRSSKCSIWNLNFIAGFDLAINYLLISVDLEICAISFQFQFQVVIWQLCWFTDKQLDKLLRKTNIFELIAMELKIGQICWMAIIDIYGNTLFIYIGILRNLSCRKVRYLLFYRKLKTRSSSSFYDPLRLLGP